MRGPIDAAEALVAVAPLVSRWIERLLVGHQPQLTVTQFLALQAIAGDDVSGRGFVIARSSSVKPSRGQLALLNEEIEGATRNYLRDANGLPPADWSEIGHDPGTSFQMQLAGKQIGAMHRRPTSSSPSLGAHTWARRALARLTHRSCAICGAAIARGEPSLRLNGMEYHITCVHFRPGQRLTG